MVNTAQIRTIIGVIGNVVSFFLFLSPIMTFKKIHKAKSVESFKPDPYVMTVLNCAMWVFYGLPIVHPDTILVTTINAVGLAIELSYVTMFIIYSDKKKRNLIFLVLFLEAVFVIVIVLVALLGLHGTKQRSLLVGIICIILNIIMYFSPLTIMKRVITTKSVKYMPFWLSVANFANGAVWTAYALLKFDINVVLPNGLGTLSGAIQLILYAIYYRKIDPADDKERPSQVELTDQP